MNVKKISQFVVIIAAFFSFFGFGSSAFATTMHFIEVNPHHISGTTYCIPQAQLSNPDGYGFSPPYSDPTHIEWQAINVGTYTGTAPAALSNTNPYNSGSGGVIYPISAMSCEGGYSSDISVYGATNVAMIIWQEVGSPARTNDWVSNDVGYVYYALFASSTPTYTPPTPHIATFTYSTTTATANITGYWEATTTPYITQRLSFWQFSDTLGKERYQQVIATTTGAFNFSFTFNDPYAWSSGESSTTPIFSSFSLNASLDQYDETNEVFPYGGETIDNLDATSTIISASVYNASDFISTPRDLALYPEYECGITSMMGCIKNAAIWLFYPTQDALDSWTTLKTTLETKAPFGYFYSVKSAVGGLSATSTPSFSLTIPAHLKTYIFDPFDIGIAGILWFFFIFHFYKRLKEIQI